jgi:hypothetical protein
MAKRMGDRTEIGVYRTLSLVGGFALYNPDKIIDYSRTPRWARYAFTFWGFPREQFVANLKAYREFSTQHWQRHGFHCNLPLGSYFVRKDTKSLLSYSYDGDVISIDPIHAPCPRDQSAWDDYLHAFNAWAHARGGFPLLNQSPFVSREHVLAAYGDRWRQFSAWIREVDPTRRMVNPFFEELLV